MFRVKKSQRGQALILIAAAIIGLVAVVGLAVDGGNSFNERRHAQSVADSIAMSAALAKATEKANWRDLGLEMASQNGYEVSMVTINNPPSEQDCDPDDGKSSPYVGDNEYIQVVIRTAVTPYFSQVVGRRQFNICVESVSRAVKGKKPLFGGYGIVALAPNGEDYHLEGSFTLRVQQGNLFSNSSSTTPSSACGKKNPEPECGPSLHMTGNPRIYLDPGYGVHIAGSGVAEMCAWCTPLPTVTNGFPQYSDADIEAMFANMPPRPNPPTCSGNGTIDTVNKVVKPGNFPTGINISGSGTWTFQSGTYCLGGDFYVASIASVNSPTSDVVLVMGNRNVTMAGGTVFYFRSLEVYSGNGNWTITGGSDLYTNRLRYISSGTGVFTAASDTILRSLSGGEIPDALFYLTAGYFSWDAGAQIYLHAPPEGDFAGLLVYMPWTNTNPITFQGGTNYSLTGTFLMPHVKLTITAGNNTNAFRAQFIAYRYWLAGGAGLNLTHNTDGDFELPTNPTLELAQ